MACVDWTPGSPNWLCKNCITVFVAHDGTLPVLFDDAFANSDPERQAGVFRMLQQAADQGLQVILLTCDPERSRGIEGASHTSLGL